MSGPKNYFADIASELRRQSDRLRIGFSSHHPTIGGNREHLVAEFLSRYLPHRFEVESGLVLSRSGEFSREPDVLIVDAHWNAPLYPEYDKKLWLAESVYALLEVKTRLAPSDLRDAVAKCQRFKSLPRTFQDTTPPRISESLFIIWAFECAGCATLKEAVLEALAGVPRTEHPDFIVVPDSVLIMAGSYRELSVFGMPGSPRRRHLEATGGHPDQLLTSEPLQVMDLGSNSLFVFFLYLTSWLKGAGDRSAPLQSYMGDGLEEWGKLV